ASPLYRSVDRDGTVTITDQPSEQHNVGNDGGGGTSASDAGRAPENVDELVDRSGLERHLGLLGSRLQRQFEAQRSVTPDARAALSRVAMNAYRLDVLLSPIREQLALRRDNSKMDEMLMWYRSPLGARLVKLEFAAAVAQTGREIAQYAERLKDTPPTHERVASLLRLDAAVGNPELAVDLAMVIHESTARAIDPVLPAGRRMKSGQLQQELAQARARLVAPTRDVVLVTMLFTYRAVSDEDLRTYVRVMESPAGRWFCERIKKALLRSNAAAADATATELARVVPPEAWLRGEFKKPPLPY